MYMLVIFQVANFCDFVKSIYSKYSVANSLFFDFFNLNHHNCLEYESVLKILHIAEFV
jgi:hypothetical protein